MNYREFKKFSIDSVNKKRGTLTGYDCPICLNKGFVEYLDNNDNECAKECSCMSIRYAAKVAESSGFGEMLKRCTLKTYNHSEKWQNDIFIKAQEFTFGNAAAFYIGGQTGAGKTHICTAISREFIKQRLTVLYAIWNSTVLELKQNSISSPVDYAKKMDELKNVDVLVIDDFFKTDPTKTDKDKAFDLINYRYNLSLTGGRKKYTIISSERTLNELNEIDPAIMGRIYEMANKKFIINVELDKFKNYRISQL